MSYIILITIIVHQVFLYFVKGKSFDLFNIYFLIDIVLLSMFFLGVNSDMELSQLINYNISFFLAVYLGILGLYLGLHFSPFYRTKRTNLIPTDNLHIKFSYTLFPIIIFLAAIAMIVLSGMRQSGLGLFDYLVKGRMAEYLSSAGEKNQEGAFWFQIVTGFRPLLLFLMCYYFERKKWLFGIVVYLFMLIGILCIFNTRLEVVITLAVPVAYWHYRVKRIKIWILILAIPLFLGFLTFLDIWRNEGVENMDKIELDQEKTNQGFSRDINAVRGFEKLWSLESKGELDKEYGLNYVYMIMTPVPRFLWRDKPVLAFEPRWTTKVVQDFSGGVWIFTAWGEGIAQFGVFGIFFNLFMYGVIIKIALKKFSEYRPYFCLVWFYYAILASTFLRGGLQALFIMTVFYFLPLACFMMFLKRHAKLNIYEKKN